MNINMDIHDIRIKYAPTVDYLIKTAIENPGKFCGSDGIPLFSEEKPEFYIYIKYNGENTEFSGDKDKLETDILHRTALDATAPEMLETLISYVLHFENKGQHFLANMGKNDIEKATGKSWKEIKDSI